MLEEELMSVFRNALKSGRFIGGPMVEYFEKDFAEFCNTKYCVGVGSGTDALRFALIASGVSNGDTVITVPNTFIATTEAISQAGAVPDFIDIDKRTYNIDTDKLREYLEIQCDVDDKTGKTFNRKTGKHVTAIIPVHLYGQMADMDSILESARHMVLNTFQRQKINGGRPVPWVWLLHSVFIPVRISALVEKAGQLLQMMRRLLIK
jgi:dTDP-4-amino-4,6-dideoxygalactose transaminase